MLSDVARAPTARQPSSTANIADDDTDADDAWLGELIATNTARCHKSLAWTPHSPRTRKRMHNVNQDVEEEFKWGRSKGAGSTDKTKWCGHDPYGSAYDHFRYLRGDFDGGDVGPSEELAAMAAHGHRIEPLGAYLYELFTGFSCSVTGVWQHHTHFWSHTSPDRRVRVIEANAELPWKLIRAGDAALTEGALEIKSNIFGTKDPADEKKYIIQMQYQMNTLRVPWDDFASLWVLTPLTQKRSDGATGLVAELRLYRQYAEPAFADAMYAHCEPIARALDDPFYQPVSWDAFNARFFKGSKDGARGVVDLPFRRVETRPLLHALWTRSSAGVDSDCSRLWSETVTDPEEMFVALGAPAYLEYGRILSRAEVLSKSM